MVKKLEMNMEANTPAPLERLKTFIETSWQGEDFCKYQNIYTQALSEAGCERWEGVICKNRLTFQAISFGLIGIGVAACIGLQVKQISRVLMHRQSFLPLGRYVAYTGLSVLIGCFGVRGILWINNHPDPLGSFSNATRKGVKDKTYNILATHKDNDSQGLYTAYFVRNEPEVKEQSENRALWGQTKLKQLGRLGYLTDEQYATAVAYTAALKELIRQNDTGGLIFWNMYANIIQTNQMRSLEPLTDKPAAIQGLLGHAEAAYASLLA